MRCKSCPMYVIDVDPEGITMRLCKWDGHQTYDNMECDAHIIRLENYLNMKEIMRRESQRDEADKC